MERQSISNVSFEITCHQAFVLDVDGVLTDNTVLLNEAGEQLRKFFVRDGIAIKAALKHGYKICVISGGKSKGISSRLEGLGISEIYLGVEDKAVIYQNFISRYKLEAAQVLYMGDDLPDIAPMKLCGVPVCPADAIEEVKTISDYISPLNGGFGCVRDIIEKVMKVRGEWGVNSEQ